MKTIAVIGLGKFGFNIAKGLAEQGVSVIAVDQDRQKVQEVSDFIADAIILDSTDIKALKEAGIVDFETVVISIGENIEASILTLMALKELGNKNIIAKAITSTHGEILSRLGAFKVIYPERESAKKLTETLVNNVVVDRIDFSSTVKIVKFLVTPFFIHKTIQEIENLHQNNIYIIACKTDDIWIFDISKNHVIKQGDMLAFIGKNQWVDKLKSFTLQD